MALACLLMVACGSKTENTGTEGDANKPDGTETSTGETKPTGRYKSGDVLYVYAKSGLVLRDKPDQAGAKIVSVPARTKVDVVDSEPFTVAFSTKEPSGLEIKGHWVKVKALGKEGYLFDGFLLSYKPFVEEDFSSYWNAYSKVKSTTDKPTKSEKGPNYYSYEKTEWENGISYESSGYEGGSNSVLILPKALFTFQEAYVFTMLDMWDDAENPTTCKYDAAKKMVECNSKDELAFNSIQEKANGDIVVEDSYAD